MAARVNQDNFENEVLQAEGMVIVDFYSDSCIPCKQMAAILGELEDDFEDRIKIVKVNVNFDETLANQYGIMASPTLLFFKGAKEISRLRGIHKKAVVQELIEQNL